MKIAIITDIHFGVRNNSEFFLNHYEKFFREVFFPRLEQEGITDVLILGDTWEERKTLNANTLDRARKMFFDPLLAKNIKVKVIYGNHDVFYKDTNDVNMVDLIGDLYPNVHVVKTHEVFNFDGLKIGMISWINKENLEDSLAWMNTVDAPYLCGHFEIRSFQMIKGQVCEHGFDKSQFERFERVFSGHFHYMSDDGRICYVSNPFQTNWSDYGLDKGFRILDTDTKELETVKNPFGLYEKIVVREDVDLLKFNYESFQDKFVKVYVKSFGDMNQHKIALFTHELGKHAYQISVEEIDETLIGSLTDDGEFDYADTVTVIEEYIRTVVNPDSNVDKVRLKSIFMSLYNEAANMSLSE